MYREISLIVVALAILLTVTLSLADDQCKKLKENDYKLYGTKTTYETARKFLSKVDDLAHSFDEDTLEEEHKELIKDSCKPVVLYFIGRHAARFPDGEDIEKYNRRLEELKQIMRQQSSLSKCPEKFNTYVNWTSRMSPNLDNLMTELGAKEQRDIAKRFKHLYPEFFSTETSDIKIGVTSKLRTAQTGVEFLKEVKGLNLPSCDEASLPMNDIEKNGYDINRILQHPCYKTLMDKNQLPFLEFHKQCDKIGGKDKIKDPRVEKIKNQKVVQEIIDRVTKKLGLPEGPKSPIDSDTLEVILDMCKFESAYKNNSIWCSLFEKKDIEILEYIKDTEIYISNAYGARANSRQACPLIKDLVENFQQGLNLEGLQNEKRKSYFYFSHAGPMKKILAAFDMFQDNDSYTDRRIEEFVTKGKVDKEREWQSSLIVPFSANMAFVLYRCEKPGKSVKHKIIATVTEKPVKLGKCKDTQCSSTKFFDGYIGMKDCDLNKICRRQ